MDNKKKKKSGSGISILIVLLILVLPRLLEALEDSNFDRWLSRWIWQLQFRMLHMGLDPELLPVIAVGILVLIAFLITAAKSAQKKRAAEAPRTSANASAGTVRIPAPAALRRPSPPASSATTRGRITLSAINSSASPSWTNG